MRQLLGFGLSLALALVVAWAGLHYDRALLDGAILIALLVTVLWLWSWGKPAPRVVSESVSDSPAPENPKRVAYTNALKEIRNAIQRESILGLRTSDGQREEVRAVLESAFATCRKQFDLPTPQLTDVLRPTLERGANFLRTVQPYLRAQHFDEAKAAAKEFLKQ